MLDWEFVLLSLVPALLLHVFEDSKGMVLLFLLDMVQNLAKLLVGCLSDEMAVEVVDRLFSGDDIIADLLIGELTLASELRLAGGARHLLTGTLRLADGGLYLVEDLVDRWALAGLCLRLVALLS